MSMPTTFRLSRLTGFPILAVAGATALSVGACSSPKNAQSPASSSAPVASNGNGSNRTEGLIASVSGNTVKVTEQTGAATVDVSPSAKINEFVTAQLSDVAPGSCARLATTPAGAPGGAPTADFVQLIPLVNGQCMPGDSGPSLVVGTVAAVEGNNIKVTVNAAGGNPSQTEVPVTDTTNYSKSDLVTVQALAQGKCLNALGTVDGSGTLQATEVTLNPAVNGHCPH
jgi:hypothetical protein